MSNRQFGRFVEVEIRDFNSNVKTTIGNEFEIEFEYFKTLDQTQQDDSGRIRIYGLTNERIKSLQVEGGEVRLRCGYLNSQIDTLFIASIARLYSETNDNTSLTTIECSANLLTHYYMGGASVGGKVLRPLLNFLEDFSDSIGAAKLEFPLGNIPKPLQNDFITFLKTRAINATYTGTLDIVIDAICQSFGLTYRKGEVDGILIIAFDFSDIGVERTKKSIKEGYVKVINEDEISNERYSFFDTLKSEDTSKEAIILNELTGLIESKIEYKIATAYADQVALSGNDVETLKSQQSRSDKISKENERIAKAKAKGKAYNSKKVAEKRTTIKVNRRYNRIKALLNPLLKPQSMVLVFESPDVPEENKTVGDNTSVADKSSIDEEGVVSGEYGLYRVRNATYKGNNKRSDWIMDLYCEDTKRNSVTQEEIDAFEATNPEDSLEIEGSESLNPEEPNYE
jgi:hypothetical protein